MSKSEVLIKRLDAFIDHGESVINDLRDLRSEILKRLEDDSIAKGAIQEIYGELNLEEGSRRVLEFIKSKKVVTRTEISQRFSRIYNSEQLYGPVGILSELVREKLLDQRTVDNGRGRPSIAYSVPMEAKIKGAARKKEEEVSGELIPAT